MEDLDAGVDEGRDLPLLPAAQTADGVHQVIPDALVAEGAAGRVQQQQRVHILVVPGGGQALQRRRSEEHTSELQSLMRISNAEFCLKNKQTYAHYKCDYMSK